MEAAHYSGAQTPENVSVQEVAEVAVLATDAVLLLPIFIIFIITGVFGNCLVCLAIYTNR